MPSDKPIRLRRTAIGRTPPSPDSLVRAGLLDDRPPTTLTGGEAVVPAHEGAGPRSTIAGNFEDKASAAKVNHPSGVHTVFELEK